MRRTSFALIFCTLMITACDKGTTNPIGPTLTGKIYVDYTFTGAATPYKREDAAGKTLELRLEPLTENGEQSAPISTTRVNTDLTYSLPLPALDASQLGSYHQLPSQQPMIEFTADCRDSSSSLSDKSVQVRSASTDLVFPDHPEPMIVVEDSGAVNEGEYGKSYYAAFSSLVYVDRDVNDSRVYSCMGPVNPQKGVIDVYYNFGSLLALKKGWNVVVTETNVTESGAGAGAMKIVQINVRATQDFSQLLMSAR